MSEWISVKDRLPEHHQVVLIYKPVPSNTGYLVAYFIDSKKMNDELGKTVFADERVDIAKNPYYFASREQQRFTIKNVTHWMPLPNPPEYTSVAKFIKDNPDKVKYQHYIGGTCQRIIGTD